MEEEGDVLTWWVVTCLTVSWFLLAVTSISLWSLCASLISLVLVLVLVMFYIFLIINELYENTKPAVTVSSDIILLDVLDCG